MEYIGYFWEFVAAIVIVWCAAVTCQEWRAEMRNRRIRDAADERIAALVPSWPRRKRVVRRASDEPYAPFGRGE